MVIEMTIVFRVTKETAKSCVVWARGCMCPDFTTFHIPKFLVNFLPASVWFSRKPGCKAMPPLPNATGANKPYHCETDHYHFLGTRGGRAPVQSVFPACPQWTETDQFSFIIKVSLIMGLVPFLLFLFLASWSKVWDLVAWGLRKLGYFYCSK